MNSYKVGEHTFAIIDGELWLKVQPIGKTEIPTVEVPTQPLKSKTVIVDKRKRKSSFPEQQLRALQQDLRSGEKVAVLAAEREPEPRIKEEAV